MGLINKVDMVCLSPVGYGHHIPHATNIPYQPCLSIPYLDNNTTDTSITMMCNVTTIDYVVITSVTSMATVTAVTDMRISVTIIVSDTRCDNDAHTSRITLTIATDIVVTVLHCSHLAL